MSWILFAVLGHLANGVAFMIDKALLRSTWKSSATYAAFIGGMSAIVLGASPWVEVWPEGRALCSSIVFGGVFVFGIWAFFEALRDAETSRVVPIVGSVVPLLTLLGTTIFLHERFTARTLVGFFLLLLATFLLSQGNGRGQLSKRTRWIVLCSATCFAVASVAGKDAFTRSSFLGVFIVSRLIAVLVGVLIGWFVQGARRELLAMISTPSRSSKHPGSLGLAIVGQVVGSFGFILVNTAINLGSVALVNALQAVQYALIVLVAWMGGPRLQRILQEDVSRRAIFLKSLAIALMAGGLWLITV